MKKDFKIREVITRDELLEVEALQEKTWGFSRKDIVGANELGTFQKNGGSVIVAIDDYDNRKVGFIFGLPAISGEQLYFHSVMCGVLPEYRFNGIGYHLLLEQQKFVQKQGVEVISAYIDPLEGIALNLVLNKFRGRSNKYIRNLFGSDVSGICAGLGTDRLLIKWGENKGTSENVKAPLKNHYSATDGINVEVVNTTHKRNECREIVGYKLDLLTPHLMIEIPSNFQKIKSIDLGLATNWRTSISEILEFYLNLYSIVDIYLENKEEKRSFLILDKI